MVISTESAIDIEDYFERTYDDAVVYGDREGETVIHEGTIRLLLNGWVELPSGRLLSPQTVDHIDTMNQ